MADRSGVYNAAMDTAMDPAPPPAVGGCGEGWRPTDAGVRKSGVLSS